ncbi:hypothetical protein [Euzebya tangerina]|uniref:hypothetical protein n=1 Tax=Euzebya tangerina TaxID=591198 RepID=UPI000E314103|nr:hypothetical protein [Euzebya tangerina]
MENNTIKDIVAAALGVLALALGVGAIRGVLVPVDGVQPSNLPFMAVTGLISGVAGLYIGPMRGRFGRQVAVIGTGVALIGIAVFGGSIALELILEAGS